jgi:hypothetical protein
MSEQLTLKLTALPAYDDLYAFLKRWYKRDRFEGRNDGDYPDYSHIVTRGRMQDLEQQGWDLISRHESNTGETLIFSASLEIIEVDRPFWRMTKDEQRAYANGRAAGLSFEAENVEQQIREMEAGE